MPKSKVHVGGDPRGGGTVKTHPRRGGRVKGYMQHRPSGKSRGK